ncbi:erythroid differentiation-related factor 1 [Octodon degus]|uniref:Erythroid differentiation-related factor 1 n=1 Tax=Octodon degus TaxID=10160 RepID=A0A6P6DY38_OCTDE|nr:erythroid differentiation-related factor 1 [Octodon degus]
MLVASSVVPVLLVTSALLPWPSASSRRSPERAGVAQTGDWTWLKEFYQRLIDQKWQRKKKSKEHWYQKAILSKFLYYSVNGDGAAQPVPSAAEQQESPSLDETHDSERVSWPAPFEMASSVSEDPSASGQEHERLEPSYIVGHMASAPKEQSLSNLFSDGENSQGLKNDVVQNILWTFEDIRKLVGSNMPIFGRGRYPAVSLRLRYNNKPISVLTGIDYWLHNLIYYVPELVMCFHINAVVQKYEMMKTEEIPNLENSKFSTEVIKDIAQNILSFLKRNCTKEGHTYWLFKANGSEVVKLYDLTTLCEDTKDKYKNPFAMPVAILLYKVACYMMKEKNESKEHYGTIRTLLLNCVKLLDKSRHPQIIASVNFMLSELFQLDEPKKEESSESPLNKKSDESHSKEKEEMPDSNENRSYSTSSAPSNDSRTVAIIKSVGELSVPEKYKSIHQIRGLKSVDRSIEKEFDISVTDPNTPIPLKYKDESTTAGHEELEKWVALLLDNMGSLQKRNYSSQSGMIPGSWQHKMKLQLILKSAKAYYVLSDAAMSLQKYGRALRYIKLALQSHDTYCWLYTNMFSELLFLSHCLMLCGDIHLMLAQNANNRAAHLEEFNYETEDLEILHSLHRETSFQVLASYHADAYMRAEENADASVANMLPLLSFVPQAVDYYLKALRSLRTRDIHPAVWDSVNWELSTTYFTMATLQQDYAPLSRKAQEQIEKEVREAMMKSLKYCDVDLVSPRQPLCQYRAATIHHRLASMYHSCLRNQVDDECLRKQHWLLADLHYNKAVKLFQLLKDAPCELLRVQLERVALAEFQMTSQNSNVGKLKTLSGALDIMVRSEHAFQLIRKELMKDQLMKDSDQRSKPKGSEASPATDSSSLNQEEVIKLLSIFESRLSFLLLQSIKLLSSTRKKTCSSIDEDVVFRTNKQIYSQLLRATANKGASLLERIDIIIHLLEQLAHGGSPMSGDSVPVQ